MHGSRFSADARADVVSGRVDPRLLALIERLSRDHVLSVRTIASGHPMGPLSPSGVENSHWYGRAADIDAVDGELVATRPVPEAVLALGRTLMGLRLGRPDSVMGPAEWLAALGPGDRAGFRDDPHATAAHVDHVHLGVARKSEG